jgi:S-DNA-T family DNA segregation ATPase FtsK/SpoIIIE
MRIALTFRSPTGSRHCLVSADPSTSAGGLFPDWDVPVYLGSEAVDRAAPLADGGVRQGSILDLGSRRGAPALPEPGQRCLLVVAGPATGSWAPLPPGTTDVGRGAPISLGDQAVSRAHLRLIVGRDGRVTVEDLGSENGTLVDGAPIAGPHPVGPGETITLGASQLAVVVAPAADAALNPAGDGCLDFSRPPRIRPPLRPATIVLPRPPAAPTRAPVQYFAMLTPLLAAGAMALISHQVAFLAITVLTPLMGAGTLLNDRRRGRTGHRRQTEEYRSRLAQAQIEIARVVREEREGLRDAHPDPATALLRAGMPSSRLWERRAQDDDFLSVRIGTGTLAPSLTLSGGSDEEPPPAVLLTEAPVTLSLRSSHALGIAGECEATRDLARAIVATLAVAHSPRDLVVTVLTEPGAERAWEWVRWLPHCRPDGPDLALCRLGNDPATIATRTGELADVLARRRTATRDRRPEIVPAHLVVLDGSYRLRQDHAISPLIDGGGEAGLHFLCLDDQATRLPESCEAVVELHPDLPGSGTRLRRTDQSPIESIRADRLSPAAAELLARSLAPLRDSGALQTGGRLPASVRLLDLLGLDPPEPAAIQALWRRGRTTAIPIGRDADRPFLLDLAQGPHMLVGGTTGAGKSELLQTIVASLAANNRPDQMVFVLIDYKGGAAFRGCDGLPHTVGMVTDLDATSVERALVSLRAELQRRKAVLDAADKPDILRYWDWLGDRRGVDPLPRLVLVVDEFKVMADALPDQLKALVDIAAQGRSLGVHLILATQRPAGAVTGDMRANVNLSIALRVATDQDSVDVIGVPDAARLSPEHPGRAYLQVGTARPVAFQAARVGGLRPGLRPRAADVVVQEVPWRDLGRPLPVAEAPAPGPDDPTDLSALVEAIRTAATASGVTVPAPPWQPPLPTDLPLGEVPAPGPLCLAYGRVDLPSEQRQLAAVHDLVRQGHLLVAGAPRSGRSTLLRTLAAASVGTPASDLHLYAIDCGGGGLASLALLPRCGAVVTPADPDRVERLLGRLQRELVSRLQLLAAAGCSDLGELRGGGAPEPPPYILLLIDRYDAFVSQFEMADGGKLVGQVQHLLQNSLAAGFRLVLTGDRSLVSGRIGGMVEAKLLLRLADRTDYAVAGLPTRSLPAEIPDGRAFRLPGGAAVQIAHAGVSAEGASQAAAIRELAERPAPGGGLRPFRVDPLPLRVTVSEALHLPRSGDGALAGVGGDELSQVRVDSPVVLVLGANGSGRSTALATLASSLAATGDRRLVVITPRRSRLPELLAGVTGVSVFGPGDLDNPGLTEALDAIGPAHVIVVDDADLLADHPLANRLLTVLRAVRDGGAVFLAAAAVDEAGNFRGILPELRKSKCGLLIAPTQVAQGDILGTRLQRSMVGTAIPMRGVLIHQGSAITVQVPIPG